MSTLFGVDKTNTHTPLADRLRPTSLDNFVGQEHLVGQGKPIRAMIEQGTVPSMIFWGPPGCGKTTLARIIANHVNAHFEEYSAVSASVEDVRRITKQAQERLNGYNQKTVLFLDEIHRFNKAQQDVLMPDLEKGYVILIGATVFNPFFTLIGPLLSRSLVFELMPLSKEEIILILKRAIADKERGLGSHALKVDEEAIRFLAEICDGDARRALNALEIGALTTPKDKEGVIHFTLEIAQESIQKNRSSMTAMVMRITTRSRRLSNRCVVQTPMPRSIGWRKCSTPAKTTLYCQTNLHLCGRRCRQCRAAGLGSGQHRRPNCRIHWFAGRPHSSGASRRLCGLCT